MTKQKKYIVNTEFALQGCVRLAKRFMRESANMSDYKIKKGGHTKHNRLMRKLAQELLEGKGYILMHDDEFNETYGEIKGELISTIHGRGKKLWTIAYNDCYHILDFLLIR